MALFQLVSVKVTDPVDVAFAIGDEIIVYWDDSTDDFSVTLNGLPFTTAGTNLGNRGGNFDVLSGLTSRHLDYSVVGYSFCDGPDMVWFKMLTYYPEYPFVEKEITANSPVCDTGGGAVCDIHFNGPPIITHGTDQSDGGSITVSATSSNGTVRYSLRNEPYTSMENETGILSVPFPGDWIVYAKDVNDCTASLRFKSLFKPGPAEHYRFTWASKKISQGTSRDARVRIYEREYVGDVVELDFFNVSPFRLLKPKQGEVNDKFYPIHPTSAYLDLASITDYQFLPLFTQDNKKYRCVYEVDEGSGFVPIWQGFIVPSVYTEDFISTPYFVEIQAGDNLKTLEEEPFTDDNGNLLFGDQKIIKVIAHIMKKTGLELSIRSGINIFEANHNKTATDDPLDQTYVDVACYREGTEPFNCWRVLESILRPFGARIYQYDNQWIIEEIDRAVETYAYRVFDSSGTYVSNSTFSPIIDVKAPGLTDRAALTQRDHLLGVIPAYGNIDITSKLNYIGSIVAGGFEKEDLLSPESEIFSNAQGVFTSEEGFRDWTLRLNGTSGVSFGRVIVGRRGDAPRIGLQTNNEEDLTKSVGAFHYNPGSWSGNLRDAYIESAAKPYQYGPGDEFNFRFEYSTPARPEYAFMVLRFVIKLGSNYLQQNLSWGASEHIYRAYPAVSNSLQKFEINVPLPETTVPVDTTVQIRLYFYASQFYDYGTPSQTSDPTDGVEGATLLAAVPTTGIDDDYKVDVRTIVSGDQLYTYRVFRELRIATDSEFLPLGVLRPDDFNATTNPKIWWPVTSFLNKESVTSLRRGDFKFYLDNISLDALINGQPPPEEDTISLPISKYINENLAIDLYNFDVPDIVNAKNMYNNYFRLSDGTPTALWTRTGISESLSLQEILLKVLGANHSAPTFRITGSFVNEFARIGINNYIRITKPGSSLTASNTEFTIDLIGWSQSSLPFLTGDWTWTTDNSGSAEVTLSGATDSKKIYQAITHSGGYIEITGNINLTGNSGSTREDILWVLFYKDGSIIHTEKIKTFVAVNSDSFYEFSYTAFAPGQVDAIGFFIQNVAGAGDCTYQVGKFAPAGKDITEVYQIADYQSEERLNTYFFELMQISKTYISLAGIDTGGNNQSGSTTGREHSSAYSSAYS